jgi:hypothetical protein
MQVLDPVEGDLEARFFVQREPTAFMIVSTVQGHGPVPFVHELEVPPDPAAVWR